MTLDIGERIDFDCPRCGESVTDHFYGPCTSCRQSLRTEYQAEGREERDEEYVPKMNVTPNAVALKDD